MYPSKHTADRSSVFAGLVGAGRTETMRAIFGADPIDGGTIRDHGQAGTTSRPASGDPARHRVPDDEDRKGQGSGFFAQSIRTNLILANMKGFSTGMFLNEKRIEDAGQKNIASLRIKTAVYRRDRRSSCRRQPAEGCYRQVGQHGRRHLYLRRADPWYRRRRKGRGLQRNEQPGKAGQVRYHGLLGNA
ncbi:MAG: hypothetical protein ACLR4Z_10080 [Butyricicoccaceae bacterium]